MIQVKIFSGKGIWNVTKGKDQLNEFLKTIPEEDIVKIDKIDLGTFMLVFKTKLEEKN